MKKMFVMGAKALFMAVMVAIMAVVAAQVSGNSVAYALGAPVAIGILYEGVKQVMEHKRLMKELRVGTFRTTLEQRAYMAAKRRNANR